MSNDYDPRFRSIRYIPDKASGLEKAFRLLDTLLRFADDGFVGIKRIVGCADDIRQFLQFKNGANDRVYRRLPGTQGHGELLLFAVNIETYLSSL